MSETAQQAQSLVIEYSFAPLCGEVEEAVARLFYDDAAEKSSARLRWRFNQGPHGQGGFALARDSEADGRIVGLIGLIALRLRVGMQVVDSIQAVDVIVDNAYRGRGVFTGLGSVAIEGARRQGKQLLWGFPNASAAPAWFGRFGWLRFGTVPFMIRPLRSGYFLRRLMPSLKAIDLLFAKKRAVADPAVRTIVRFGQEADCMWERFARSSCGVERDSAYLNWRLIDRPGSEYRTVATFDLDGGMTALVASILVDRHEGRILYIMEAMSLDPAALARLLRHEIALAAGKGADAALCWSPPTSPARTAFRRAGFMPFAERLRPMTMHFGAKPLNADVPPAVRDGDCWYLSYLDSDTI